MSRNIYKPKQAEAGLRIITHKQMLQRLPIALAQMKAGSNLESLLNEIRQIVFFVSVKKNYQKSI